MKTHHSLDEKPRDSFDYCIEFWAGALDAEEEIEHFVREASPHGPRHVRAADDVA
jgi:hypothetical protein